MDELHVHHLRCIARYHAFITVPAATSTRTVSWLSRDYDDDGDADAGDHYAADDIDDEDDCDGDDDSGDDEDDDDGGDDSWIHQGYGFEILRSLKTTSYSKT